MNARRLQELLSKAIGYGEIKVKFTDRGTLKVWHTFGPICCLTMAAQVSERDITKLVQLIKYELNICRDQFQSDRTGTNGIELVGKAPAAGCHQGQGQPRFLTQRHGGNGNERTHSVDDPA